MSECVVCQRRPPERPTVCEGCRRRIDGHLNEIVDLYALLPAHLERGSSGGEKVSGSREAPIPLALDVLDLSLPLRGGQVVHDPEPGYQVGVIPVVWTLDSWARDWQATLVPDQRLPVPTVATLAGWLRDRLHLACGKHPAIDECAEELRETVATLRGVLGRADLRHRLPAPCPDCEMLTLYREDGAEYVECGSCHRLWSEDEYAWLVRIAVEEVA